MRVKLRKRLNTDHGKLSRGSVLDVKPEMAEHLMSIGWAEDPSRLVLCNPESFTERYGINYVDGEGRSISGGEDVGGELAADSGECATVPDGSGE